MLNAVLEAQNNSTTYMPHTKYTAGLSPGPLVKNVQYKAINSI